MDHRVDPERKQNGPMDNGLVRLDSGTMGDDGGITVGPVGKDQWDCNGMMEETQAVENGLDQLQSDGKRDERPTEPLDQKLEAGQKRLQEMMANGGRKVRKARRTKKKLTDTSQVEPKGT